MRICAQLTTVALALAASASFAQDYPVRPLKLIVPIAAGGLTDNLARTLAARLGERMGQPVVVENRPGGGGVIGMQAAARSPADGYSLILVYQGVASVNASLYRNLPYDTLRDFVAVGQVASFPLLLLVNPAVNARSTREFIELARAGAGSINYASAGNATTSHLAMELFKRAAGIELTHVPYKGEAPALTEVVGGAVPVAFATATAAMPMIQAGRLRALAISSSERSRALPDLPTIAESGVAGFDVIGWYGLLAPAGTPAPVVARLNRELLAIVAEPETRAKLAAQGVEPRGGSPEAFAKLIRDETERWRKVIADANIRVE
jgi:tripartite-type tricarboxylate transporter receptor subunit TctC